MVGAESRSIEAGYLDADGDPVTVSFDRVDPGLVVHGLPVRDVRSRAGQRKVLGPLADPVAALPVNGLVQSTLDTALDRDSRFH